MTKGMKFAPLGPATPLAFLISVCAGAALSQSPSDLARLSIEELMDIPVYAASRFEQRAVEAPASVTIVTSREIEAYGWRTLGEILNATVGFYLSSDRSYQFAGVRGFSRPGDYNSRYLVLVDGVRTNEKIFESAGIGLDFNLDIDLVERVEIVRGAGSAIYGTNAFFGIINVVTRSGADLDGVEAAASAGSGESYGGRLSVGAPVGGTGEYLLSGTYRGSGNAGCLCPGPAESASGAAASGPDGETAGSLFAKLRRGGAAFVLMYVDRTKDRPTGPYGTILEDPRNFDADARFAADLSYGRNVGGRLDVDAHATFQDYRYEGIYVFDGAAEGEPADPVVNRDEARSQWWGVEIKLSSGIVPRNRVTAGAEYRDYFTIDQKNYDVDPPARLLDSRCGVRMIGVSAQNELRISSRALLNAGLRYDRTHPHDRGELSPRVALVLNPSSATAIKLIYGESFRNPSAFELHYHDGYISSKDNHDLRPEKIRIYEAAAERRFGDRILAGISAYRYEIHNLIGQVLDPSDGLLQYRNSDAIEAAGMEISFVCFAPGGIEGRASYSYMNAHDMASGGWLDNSPRSTANLNVMSPLVKRRFRGALEAVHVGDRRTRAGGTAGGYTVVNATGLAAASSGGLRLSLSVYNVFGEEYSYPAGAEFEQDAIGADGRAVRLKCAYGF